MLIVLLTVSLQGCNDLKQQTSFSESTQLTSPSNLNLKNSTQSSSPISKKPYDFTNPEDANKFRKKAIDAGYSTAEIENYIKKRTKEDLIKQYGYDANGKVNIPKSNTEGQSESNDQNIINTATYSDGYQWAEDNDPDDVSLCSNKSDAFYDGCRAYVVEMAKEFPEDYSY